MLRHRAALLATVCLLSVANGGASAQVPTPPIAASSPGSAPPPAPPAPATEAPATQADVTAPPPAPHHVHHRARPVVPGGRAPLPTRGTTHGDTIQAIRVTGNERIEEGTILSYMLVQPGDQFSGDRVDKSLRTLYATGLFADVSLRRDGDALVVKVTENPLVNRITFEGNHNIKEDDLRKELTLRARAVFSVRAAETDRRKLLNVYAGKGRFAATVEPSLVRLPQNRVNVVFRVVEGPKTLISRIVFVGNHAFSENELRGVVDSREERWYKFFSSSDEFNPEKVNFDRELLRRFYLSKGYADFEVTGTTAELAPDRKAFFITYQINEGERYTIGHVEVKSTVPKLDGHVYQKLVTIQSGAFYNGDLVERTGDLIEDRIRADQFAFVKVNPRIARNRAKHSVDLLFDIVQGPRVYVDRIEIAGNTVTRDNVIRREFRFAEGDPLDQTLVRQTKQRLNDLGYFGDVKVTPTPGPAADRTVIAADVTEKATGELSLGGGYSTDAGILGQAGLRQRNLLGTGIDAGINGTLAAQQSQIDISATDPYFLERNLVGGADIFFLNNNNLSITDYQETRYGTTLRLGYGFNDHVSQAISYSLIDRSVNNIQPFASQYVLDEAGNSLLSQIGQTLSFDWRDSRVAPHSGFVLRIGTDLAGLGGDEKYLRSKIDGTYFIPLEYFTGDPDWNVAVSAGAGYLYNLQSRERIIDRFFLGGDNLRGFLDQGAGPHSVAYTACDTPTDIATTGPLAGSCRNPGLYHGSDSLGGNRIWTQSTELHFPLPVSADLGLAGRAFIDTGSLSGLNVPPNALTDCLLTSHKNNNPKLGTVDDHGTPISACFYDDSSPRVAVGVGISWKSPFGLINVDIGIPVLKKNYDQTQIFKFGFGTRFQ